jgi:hypothetical protein
MASGIYAQEGMSPLSVSSTLAPSPTASYTHACPCVLVAHDQPPERSHTMPVTCGCISVPANYRQSASPDVLQTIA